MIYTLIFHPKLTHPSTPHEMITHQSQVIKALQDENQSLQKKQMQITESSQVLQESESKLEA